MDTATDFSDPESLLAFIQGFEFPYYPGSIFPSEMALFLYRCDQVGVKTLIESGRGEGYSTALLAAYGEARHVRVLSVDWEIDHDIVARCRQRLAPYQHLELVVGDAFKDLPTLLASAQGPVGLLLDGPKRHEAVYLSAAAMAFGPVRVIAHHNTVGDPWYDHFAWRFPHTEYLEVSDLVRAPTFPAFRAWECEVARDTPARDVEQTSLALCVLPETGPTRVYLRGPSWKDTLAPTLLVFAWKLGIRASFDRLYLQVRFLPRRVLNRLRRTLGLTRT